MIPNVVGLRWVEGVQTMNIRTENEDGRIFSGYFDRDVPRFLAKYICATDLRATQVLQFIQDYPYNAQGYSTKKIDAATKIAKNFVTNVSLRASIRNSTLFHQEVSKKLLLHEIKLRLP